MLKSVEFFCFGNGEDIMDEGLIGLIESFDSCRLMVVGDVLLDSYITGQLDRVSPEAPVGVLSVESESSLPGGAANVARNLCALGARVALLSVIGVEETSRVLQGLLEEQPRLETFFVVDKQRTTPLKQRFLAQRQHVLRVDKERADPIEFISQEALLEQARLLMAEIDGVVISDYGKGVLPPLVLEKLIALAKKEKKEIFVDPKGNDYGIYKGVTLITPNRKELSEAAGLGKVVKDDVGLKQAAEVIFDQGDPAYLLVTRSEDGMSLYQKIDGEVANIFTVHPVQTEEVVDVCGAGDTVISVVSLARACGASFEQAVRLSNVAAGLVIQRLGTATLSPSSLVKALEEESIFLRSEERLCFG